VQAEVLIQEQLLIPKETVTYKNVTLETLVYPAMDDMDSMMYGSGDGSGSAVPPWGDGAPPVMAGMPSASGSASGSASLNPTGVDMCVGPKDAPFNYDHSQCEQVGCCRFDIYETDLQNPEGKCKSAVGNAPCGNGAPFAQSPPDTSFAFNMGYNRRRSLKKQAQAGAGTKLFPGSRRSLLQYDGYNQGYDGYNQGYDGFDSYYPYDYEGYDGTDEFQEYLNMAESSEMAQMMYDMMGPEPTVVKIRSEQPVASTDLMAVGLYKPDSVLFSEELMWLDDTTCTPPTIV
jgi:hypothetical protein